MPPPSTFTVPNEGCATTVWVTPSFLPFAQDDRNAVHRVGKEYRDEPRGIPADGKLRLQEDSPKQSWETDILSQTVRTALTILEMRWRNGDQVTSDDVLIALNSFDEPDGRGNGEDDALSQLATSNIGNDATNKRGVDIWEFLVIEDA
ncbi:hypothetical protein B0H16DRAFT_1469526 [Mycena metata]|uniref:Uncharacterized protein n=1 Tax=Mycena metata TaxID=1033252 RepID=A0AAD7HXJ2_9AGAR|nr:hypothetical protein B0H16DRAFT_1469526 [Mycena metata]